MICGKRGEWEWESLAEGVGDRRPVIGEGGLGSGWPGRGQVVTPDVADDLRVAIAGIHAWLPGDGAWRVEHLHPVGDPVVPAWGLVVVHGHPEHLTRLGQVRAVKGLADPAGAVDRGVLGGVGEYGEDRSSWGVNDRGCVDGFLPGAAASHLLLLPWAIREIGTALAGKGRTVKPAQDISGEKPGQGKLENQNAVS